MHTPIEELEGREIPSLNPHRKQKVIEVTDQPETVLVISEGFHRNMICTNHAYKSTALIY